MPCLLFAAHHLDFQLHVAPDTAQVARVACRAVRHVLRAERDFHIVLLAYQGVILERLSADHASHSLFYAETAYNPLCETGFMSSSRAISFSESGIRQLFGYASYDRVVKSYRIRGFHFKKFCPCSSAVDGFRMPLVFVQHQRSDINFRNLSAWEGVGIFASSQANLYRFATQPALLKPL